MLCCKGKTKLFINILVVCFWNDLNLFRHDKRKFTDADVDDADNDDVDDKHLMRMMMTKATAEAVIMMMVTVTCGTFHLKPLFGWAK